MQNCKGIYMKQIRLINSSYKFIYFKVNNFTLNTNNLIIILKIIFCGKKDWSTHNGMNNCMLNIPNISEYMIILC